MFVPHVPQMWYKCGTQKGPHTFFRWFGYYALNVCIYPWKFWNKVFTILNFDFWWPLTSHTCIDIIIFILHTYPSAPKWGTFDIGAPSAPNGALNGALNGAPQSVVISDIHHNHHNHHTLWWFIWGLHLIHLSAPQSSVLNPHCTTKVWYIYVCTTCTTNVVQVWYTKGASHVF